LFFFSFLISLDSPRVVLRCLSCCLCIFCLCLRFLFSLPLYLLLSLYFLFAFVLVLVFVFYASFVCLGRKKEDKSAPFVGCTRPLLSDTMSVVEDGRRMINELANAVKVVLPCLVFTLSVSLSLSLSLSCLVSLSLCCLVFIPVLCCLAFLVLVRSCIRLSLVWS
jgi:hypothetical protein